MNIIVAKSAGFCFGVNRAIKCCYNEIGNSKNIYTYGSIIHNKEVTNDLKIKGVEIIENISDISNIENSKIIIRSHGVGKSVYDEIEKNKLNYVDGTCPFVKKIHNIVKENFNKNNNIIIIGDSNHPEIIGINGWCQNSAIIIKSVEEAKNIVINNDFETTVVVQTTFRKEKFDNIINILKLNINNINIYNTICLATDKRQKEAIELSKKVDKMIVIGDKESSNTQKLYEICKKNCRNTYYIESIYDLVLNIFNSNDKIGITAGASTPSAIIKEVISTMSEFETQNINIEKEEELSFQELLDKSLVSLHTGEIVKGKVIQVINEEVSVNLGYKSDGIISRAEFSNDINVVPSEVVKPGDEIEVYVLRVNDGEGNVLLSRKRIEAQKGISEIENAYKNKTVLSGKVLEVVKGGLITVIKGVRIFIPSSQVSNKFVDDLNIFKGQELSFNIIEFDRNKNRVIGGRKAIIEKEINEKKTKLLSSIEIGNKIKGKVSRITDFGAFVDLGGVDGLIHVSEMSWGRITNPKNLLKEGQDIEVLVIDVDKEKGKVSLSLKIEENNPWKNISEKYAEGKVVEGKVVRIVPFGAFIELEPGVDGLIHISQISEKHIAKPEDALKIGEIISVKVIEVSEEQKKISLSKKALEVKEQQKTEENISE